MLRFEQLRVLLYYKYENSCSNLYSLVIMSLQRILTDITCCWVNNVKLSRLMMDIEVQYPICCALLAAMFSNKHQVKRVCHKRYNNLTSC